MSKSRISARPGGESAKAYNNRVNYNLTPQMKKVMEMDEHKIGMDAICDRLGYRSDYFMLVGVTLGHVEYAQKKYGKNEITSYKSDFHRLFSSLFGCYTSESCSKKVNASGQDVNMNQRLSY